MHHFMQKGQAKQMTRGDSRVAWLAGLLGCWILLAACSGSEDNVEQGGAGGETECGAGTTRVNGQCVAACGAGTVFDTASGTCILAGAGGNGGTSSGGGGAPAGQSGSGGAPAGSAGSAGASAGGGGKAGSEGGQAGTSPTVGGAAGESGAAGGGGEPGGSGGGGAAGANGGSAGAGGFVKAAYCPDKIDLNCDPACGPVKEKFCSQSCDEPSGVPDLGVTGLLTQFVIQLPTEPVNKQTCCGDERYTLIIDMGTSEKSFGYTTFPLDKDSDDWTYATGDASPFPSPVICEPTSYEKLYCAGSDYLNRFFFMTNKKKTAPRTIIFKNNDPTCQWWLVRSGEIP